MDVIGHLATIKFSKFGKTRLNRSISVQLLMKLLATNNVLSCKWGCTCIVLTFLGSRIVSRATNWYSFEHKCNSCRLQNTSKTAATSTQLTHDWFKTRLFNVKLFDTGINCIRFSGFRAKFKNLKFWRFSIRTKISVHFWNSFFDKSSSMTLAHRYLISFDSRWTSNALSMFLFDKESDFIALSDWIDFAVTFNSFVRYVNSWSFSCNAVTNDFIRHREFCLTVNTENRNTNENETKISRWLPRIFRKRISFYHRKRSRSCEKSLEGIFYVVHVCWQFYSKMKLKKCKQQYCRLCAMRRLSGILSRIRKILFSCRMCSVSTESERAKNITKTNRFRSAHHVAYRHNVMASNVISSRTDFAFKK